MIKYLTIFFLFSLSRPLLAQEDNKDSAFCEITTSAKVYHFGADSKEQPSLFQHSTCPGQINEQFQRVLTNSNGPVSAEHLASLISEKSEKTKKVLIKPERIRVYSLIQLLSERIQLRDNQVLRNLSLLDKGSLLLSENEQLMIQCQNCRELGELNIELVINQVSLGKLSSRWLKANQLVKTPALVALSPQRVSHNPLQRQQFQIQTIETAKPQDYFVDQEKLPFYRLNRPLAAGSAIKHSDLAGVNLVNAGTPAKVFLKNANLSISRTAHPIRGGKFGEMVQLRNPQTNKTILGKVIDFNKVEVEL